MSTLEFDHHRRHRARQNDRWEFRLLLVLTYPIFLVIATIGSVVDLLRGSLWKGPARVARRSIFAEAYAAAVAVIPFAFIA